MKYFALILFLCVYMNDSFSQKKEHICLYDHAIGQKASENSDYARSYLSFFNYCEENFRKHSRTAEVYQIEVVFHVVYNTDAQNLADSVVLNQLQILNQDFRRLNPDAELTRDEFLPVAADTEIEFVLASYDPDGNPTNGINHVFSDRSGFEFDIFDITILDEVKHSDTQGADAWNTDLYLNVWICNIEPGFFGGLIGYAYPPNNSPNWPEGQGAPEPGEEGVVMFYPAIGSNNPVADDDGFDFNNGGRALTHEVGHYLGLRHIWGDPIFFIEDGCDVDDGIEDTPNVEAGANYNCDYTLASCETGEDALPAQIENYMDYNEDDCVNMFTQEQTDMMRFILEEFRPGLIDPSWVNIEEIDPNIEFNLYPNPSKDEITLDFGILKTYNLDFKILDLKLGQLVEQGKISQNNSNVDIQNLNTGVYILELINEDQILRKRFIKI